MDLFKNDREETSASLGASTILLLSGDSSAVKKKPPKRQPAWLYPWSAERRYSRTLVKHMDNIGKIILDIYMPHLESLTEERDLLNPGIVQKVDDYAEAAERLSESAKLNVENSPNRIVKKSVAMSIANEVNVWNSKEWQKQLRAAFGVNVFNREPFINASINSFTIENVALITNMEATALNQVAGVVQKGLRQGASAPTIAKDIQKRIDVSKSRAQFIARDQVGKLNGELTALRQTNLGVTTYIWRTSQDERVRATHSAHNGKKFRWDRPPSNTGAPGQDYQCRCYAEANFDDIFKEINE